MAPKKQIGAFPDMDELLGGNRNAATSTVEREPLQDRFEDPRGKLERTSLQMYTTQRDKVSAMAFLKRVNIYEVLAAALDEYFENHENELSTALTLQSTSNRLQRGRPRKMR